MADTQPPTTETAGTAVSTDLSERSAFALAEGILVINLDDRPDRWQSLLREAGRHIDERHLERLSAIRGTTLNGYGRPPLFQGRQRDRTWAGRAGCALSHREAIALAARRRWKSVLILEDDVTFTADYDGQAARLASALRNVHWDICYLGFTDPIGPFRQLGALSPPGALYQLYGCNTTHAYIVSEAAYAKLLELLPTHETIWPWLTRNRAIDRWYARTLSRHFTVVAVSPSIINQDGSVSDITGRVSEENHQTAIPSRHQSTGLPYALARLIRRLRFSLSGSYDALRGQIKRLRGF